MFPGCLVSDLIEIFKFTAQTRALGHSKENIVLFLEIFQLPFTIILRFLIILDSIGPVIQGISQAILDG